MKRNKRINQNNLDTPIIKDSEHSFNEKAKKQALSNFVIVFRLFLFFIICGFISGFLFTYPGFEVRNIKIKGVKYSDASKAEKAAGSCLGENVFAVMFAGGRRTKAVSAQNEVVSVKSFVTLPDTLTLAVNERKPFVLVKNGKNEYLADRNGTVFHKMAARDRVKSVPVIVSGAGVPCGRKISEATADGYKKEQLKKQAEETEAFRRNAASGQPGRFSDTKEIEAFYKNRIESRQKEIYNLQYLFNVALYASEVGIGLEKLEVDGNSSLILYLSGDGPLVEFGALANTAEKLDMLSVICKKRPDIIKNAREICLLDDETATYKPKNKARR